MTDVVGWLDPPSTGAPARGADGLVLPDGCMDLMWVDGELLVCGTDTIARPVGPSPVERFGVRFPPGHLPHLLGVPAAALVDQRAPLLDVVAGPRAAAARMARRALAQGRGSVATLEALAVQLGAGQTPTDLDDAIVRRAECNVPVAAMADELGVGARRLHRHCIQAFGYGPKVLTRVLRLQRAVRLGRRGHRPAWVAFEAGYADQPHLAREVRALTGLTWSELLPEPQASGA